MTDTELRDRMKAYVKGWEETGAILEAERDEHVRTAVTSKSIAALSSLVDSAVRMNFHPHPCGMIEFQKILSRTKS